MHYHRFIVVRETGARLAGAAGASRHPTAWHSPADDARVEIADVDTRAGLHELANDLSRRHDVAVVCGVPYSDGLEGRIIPYRVESSGPVEVRRAWGTRLPKRVPAGRMVNQASFFAMAT